jgi:hypothetical protein
MAPTAATDDLHPPLLHRKTWRLRRSAESPPLASVGPRRSPRTLRRIERDADPVRAREQWVAVRERRSARFTAPAIGRTKADALATIERGRARTRRTTEELSSRVAHALAAWRAGSRELAAHAARTTRHRGFAVGAGRTRFEGRTAVSADLHVRDACSSTVREGRADPASAVARWSEAACARTARIAGIAGARACARLDPRAAEPTVDGVRRAASLARSEHARARRGAGGQRQAGAAARIGARQHARELRVAHVRRRLRQTARRAARQTKRPRLRGIRACSTFFGTEAFAVEALALRRRDASLSSAAKPGRHASRTNACEEVLTRERVERARALFDLRDRTRRVGCEVVLGAERDVGRAGLRGFAVAIAAHLLRAERAHVTLTRALRRSPRRAIAGCPERRRRVTPRARHEPEHETDRDESGPAPHVGYAVSLRRP